MARYINADKLCEDLMNRWEIADKEKEKEIQSIMADVVVPIVVGQLSADVVEVVRCKDCRYFELTEFVADDKSRLGFCNFADNPIWDCDYCSYAERRKSE